MSRHDRMRGPAIPAAPSVETAAMRTTQEAPQPVSKLAGASVALRIAGGPVIYGTLSIDPAGICKITTLNKHQAREVYFRTSDIAIVKDRDIFVEKYWII